MKKLLVALACLAPLAALAHTASVSYSEFEVHGDSIDAQFHFSSIDLATIVKLDTQSQRDLDTLAPALARLLLEPVSVTSAGKPCPMTPGRATPDGPDGAAIRAVFSCPAPIDQLSVRPGFIDLFPQGHTHLAKIVFSPSEVFQRIAQTEEPSFEVERAPRPLTRIARFLWLGVRHIALGPEHITFLLALLLLGGRFPELIKIITSFTVAHSITLALATLGFVAPPTRVVEPLIALSVVFAAAENLWALGSAGRLEKALSHRWLLAFAFGLVHGFGFANALAGQPRRGLVQSLLSFNLGVELGQLCIVAIFLPVLWWLRKRPGFAGLGARLCSGAIAATGVVWFCARLF